MAPLLTSRARLAAVVPAALALGAGLAGCAPAAGSLPPGPSARVEVHVASRSPDAVEVHLAQARGPWRAAGTVASGRTGTFTVPAGWLTVRVPGRCVVPAAAEQHLVVEVGPDDCTVR